MIISSPKTQVINSSGTPEPPYLVFAALHPLSNRISVQQTGSQTDRWCNLWGTDLSHTWFPKPIHPYRLLYPPTDASCSIKHLSAPLARYISAQNETVGYVLLSDFHRSTVQGIHWKGHYVSFSKWEVWGFYLLLMKSHVQEGKWEAVSAPSVLWTPQWLWRERLAAVTRSSLIVVIDFSLVRSSWVCKLSLGSDLTRSI